MLKLSRFGFIALAFSCLVISCRPKPPPAPPEETGFADLPPSNEESAPRHPNSRAHYFFGTWVVSYERSPKVYSSLPQAKSFYTFNKNGTGEIVDYIGDVIINRKDFLYRAYDELISIVVLNGTVYGVGTNSTHAYKLSQDRKKISISSSLYLGLLKDDLLVKNAFELTLVETPPIPSLSFDSLPETSKYTAHFVGSWAVTNVNLEKTYGLIYKDYSVLSQVRYSYVFYNDGTGEIIDYIGYTITDRRFFLYRASAEIIGLKILKGQIYGIGVDFIRPYKLSQDGRVISFPETTPNFFTGGSLITTLPELSLKKETPYPLVASVPPNPVEPTTPSEPEQVAELVQAPPPAPIANETQEITIEKFKEVELAYEKRLDHITTRERRLDIENRSERAAFIEKWQGNPDTVQVVHARDITRLNIYTLSTTSAEKIVELAKKEKNPFLKVRLIHDWVADIFAYDEDLSWDLKAVKEIDNEADWNPKSTLQELIVNRRGVSVEYAMLFWFLMDEVGGIDVYYIADKSQDGIGLAYNMVVIDSTGYIIDTTKDSGNIYKHGEIIKSTRGFRKTYFMPSIQKSYGLREIDRAKPW